LKIFPGAEYVWACKWQVTPLGCNEPMAKFEEAQNCTKHSSEPS
jgi:hypothetical protein